jgi:hypothetical protein
MRNKGKLIAVPTCPQCGHMFFWLEEDENPSPSLRKCKGCGQWAIAYREHGPTPDYCDECRRQRQREQARLRMQRMRRRRASGETAAKRTTLAAPDPELLRQLAGEDQRLAGH